MNRLIKAVWFTATWITVAGLSTAQAPPEKDHPHEDCGQAHGVLKRFLDLDGNTGRQWTPQLMSLITDTDSPGWDTQLVIERYEIEECQRTLKGFEIPVRYWIVGKLTSAGDAGLPIFEPGIALQHVRFEVVRADDGFKVRDVGSLEPRVYPSTAIAELKKLADHGSPATRQEAVRSATQLVRDTAARLRQSR
ncbi:MAG: hypothetical protein ABSF93_04335 [Candidatus Sulfotelmatobacter sp.]